MLLGCLDTRRSRRYLNEAAWHLGSMAYLDAGVEPDGALARVSLYIPGPEAACLECGWGPNDYAALEHAYPCGGGAEAATTAPRRPWAPWLRPYKRQSARDCCSVPRRTSPAGVRSLRIWLSTKWFSRATRRNAACGCDHRTWPIEPLPRSAQSMAVGDVFALSQQNGQAAAAAFRVAKKEFVCGWSCPGCGRHTEAGLTLDGRGPGQRSRTAAGTCWPRRSNVHEWLDQGSLERGDQERPLASLGCRHGDILVVGGAGGQSYFEILGFGDGDES